MPMLTTNKPSSTIEQKDYSHGHWLNVVSHLDPRYGGLSAVVPYLGSAIAATRQFSIGLAAFCTPSELYSESNHPELSLSIWPTSRADWFRSRELRQRFHDLVNAADGVHIHGLWEHSTAAAARVARALRKPYIVSSHGMLEPWALKNKSLKKKIYSALVERGNLQGAACLHALTYAEARDYREFGLTAPIAVIPNGVHIPDSISPELFLTHFPAMRGKRLILFMGRIHFKKGLDILVKSWARLAKQWPKAHLILAGPDFENTRASIETLVVEVGIQDRVLFTGMLRNELKWSALAAAQCFVLPSYSEGLSVSVLEAMGVGLPVIVTEQCNLPEVEEFHTGWLIKSEIDPLTSSLSSFLNNSYEANTEIGARGRQLVSERYNWNSVTEQMTHLYHWVQDGGTPHGFDLVTT
jgi:glycosyltransferase involved in cell wall biosynthesis